MKFVGVFVFLLVLILGLALSTPLFSADAQGGGSGKVQVTDSNAQHIVLVVNAPTFTKNDLTVNGATYTDLEAAGWSNMDTLGKPQLPLYGTLLAIPQQAKISIRILQDKTHQEQLAHAVVPVPTPRVSQKLDDPLPTFDGNDYLADAATYGTSALYPSDTTFASEPANWRSQRYIRFQVRPFQYNPATRQLTIHDRMRIEIDFGVPANASAAQLGTNVSEGAFESVLKNSLLNYDAGLKWRSAQRTVPNLPRAESAAGTTDSFKISVNADGMYKVTCGDLQAAGLSWASFTWDTAQLSFLGNPVAIQVYDAIPNNQCNNGDYFVFFGQAPTDYAIPYNVYWLTDNGGAGKRMSSRNVTGTTPATTYSRVQHIEQNYAYIGYAPFAENEDHWVMYFLNHPSDPDGNGDPDSVDFNVDMSDLAPTTTSGTVRYQVQSGATYHPSGTLHTRLYSNDNSNPVYEHDWSYGTSFAPQVGVTNLAAGTNTFRVGDLNFGASGFFIYFNYFEVEYPAVFTAYSDTLRFKYAQTGSWQFDVPNFTQNNQINAYDITDPNNVGTLNVSATLNSGSYDASFGDNVSSASEYFVLDSSQFKTAVSVKKDTPSDLHSTSNQADYIIITYGPWKSNVQPLAAQRASLGNVQVVDVEDVYDEFDYGRQDADAIRNFLEYAYSSWQQPKPSYVLLVGDGNMDKGSGEQSFIPVYMALADPWIGMVATDNCLVTLDEARDQCNIDHATGSELPSMAIGRLPALTSGDVDGMVSKLVSYETVVPPGNGAWRKKVLFVTDNAYSPGGDLDAAGNFFDYSEEVASDPNYFPSPLVADRIYFNPCTYPQCDISSYAPAYPNAPGAHSDILDHITSGRLIVNYVGHGAANSWADALLGSVDAAALTRDPSDPKYPFMMPMTCLDGYFQSGYSTSISEALVRKANGGAIGSFAPTGFGVTTGHDYLDRGFFRAITKEAKVLVGQATTEAKATLYAESGGASHDLLNTYNLLGDPGTLLSVPDEFKPTPTPAPSPTATPTATPGPAKPSKPVLLSPPKGSEITKTKVKLQWGASEGADHYQLVVTRDTKKGTKVFTGDIAGTSKMIKKLSKNHTYYWNVKACNSIGCSKRSGWSNFKVQ